MGFLPPDFEQIPTPNFDFLHHPDAVFRLRTEIDIERDAIILGADLNMAEIHKRINDMVESAMLEELLTILRNRGYVVVPPLHLIQQEAEEAVVVEDVHPDS